jgi:hypothetical protein
MSLDNMMAADLAYSQREGASSGARVSMTCAGETQGVTISAISEGQTVEFEGFGVDVDLRAVLKKADWVPPSPLAKSQCVIDSVTYSVVGFDDDGYAGRELLLRETGK